jgi:putative transposase
VLDLLNAPCFVDQAPAEVYASLLDQGIYHCSIRTMYRILDRDDQVRERRAQLRHPAYQKPELLALGPNQVWSWDITKLMGPAKWTYFYLYVIIDIFSRCVVGWCVADAESAVLFKPLLDDAIAKHRVPPGQLTLHADRGGPMKAKATALLLADLGVTRSHNRPHTSNDNPFSESHFKTLKYQPQFPQRFGCREDARTFCRRFFKWYNQEHHHAGIGLMTPNQVHYGQSDAVYAARQDTLDRARRETPERFVNKAPTPPAKPTAVWINPPPEKQKRLIDVPSEDADMLQQNDVSLIAATPRSVDVPVKTEAATRGPTGQSLLAHQPIATLGHEALRKLDEPNIARSPLAPYQQPTSLSIAQIQQR